MIENHVVSIELAKNLKVGYPQGKSCFVRVISNGNIYDRDTSTILKQEYICDSPLFTEIEKELLEFISIEKEANNEK